MCKGENAPSWLKKFGLYSKCKDIEPPGPTEDVDEEAAEIEEEVEETPVALDDFESRLQRLREHRERHGGN